MGNGVLGGLKRRLLMGKTCRELLFLGKRVEEVMDFPKRGAAVRCPGRRALCLLVAFVGAAHALVAAAGMAVAVWRHADALQLASVLRAVMAAGLHGAMNGLIVHDGFLHF